MLTPDMQRLVRDQRLGFVATVTADGRPNLSRIRTIGVIEVTDAAPLVSPAYDDGTPEDAVVARWLEHHRRLHDRPG
ncbi:MAG TPA: pyridoxamine 5'-phosphate oxidase family protein [Acidimicrobiia bacterium]|jgi:hypothetical protein